MDKDPRLYVDHMLEAIANIETDTAGYDFEKFRKDRRVRQLVERNRHDYHDTYPSVLWKTCTKDLQPLKDALARICAMIATDNDGN